MVLRRIASASRTSGSAPANVAPLPKYLGQVVEALRGGLALASLQLSALAHSRTKQRLRLGEMALFCEYLTQGIHHLGHLGMSRSIQGPALLERLSQLRRCLVVGPQGGIDAAHRGSQVRAHLGLTLDCRVDPLRPRVERRPRGDVAPTNTRGSERIGRREHAEEKLLHRSRLSRLRFGQRPEMALPRHGADQGQGREGA